MQEDYDDELERQRLEQIMLQQDLEENRKLKIAQK
jgi:hypothetical protein